jgi:hypothetical protein
MWGSAIAIAIAIDNGMVRRAWYMLSAAVVGNAMRWDEKVVERWDD